jgi:hypothetical protein
MVVSAVITLVRKSRILPEIQASSSCLYFRQTRNMSDAWLSLVELAWQQSPRAQAPYDHTGIVGLVYASPLGHLPQLRAGFAFLGPFCTAIVSLT